MNKLSSISKIHSVFVDDALLSLLPNISGNIISTSPTTEYFESRLNCCCLNDMNKTSVLLVNDVVNPTHTQSPTSIRSELFIQNYQTKQFYSMFEAVKELCILIRKLLQHDANEQKIANLQQMITRQLAILLTYLAISHNEKVTDQSTMTNIIESMISVENNGFYL